jgi:hypothetical protein
MPDHMSSLLLLDELRKINWLWGSDRNLAQREREQRKLSREEKARKDFAKKSASNFETDAGNIRASQLCSRGLSGWRLRWR